MSLSELRALRHRLNTLFYYTFDTLGDEHRAAFTLEIEDLDARIKSMEDF